MFFKQLDLTSGSRPILQQDETLLFVQNGVGLYEGKYKIAACQNGHAYLTSHRACYIDDNEPRKNSLAIDLRDVERHEHQAGFLRSSPKIIVHPRPVKKGLGPFKQQTPISPSIHRLSGSFSSPVSRAESPFRPVAAAPPVYSGNWTCPICSFSNPVPSNFDPANDNFPIPPCLTCGVPPEFPVVLRAAIAANVNRAPPASLVQHTSSADSGFGTTDVVDREVDDRIPCPRCTYLNYKYLRQCEICDNPLPRSTNTAVGVLQARPESPGPEIPRLELDDKDENVLIKFSFRTGGDRVFHERLKAALIQRKWLITNAPPIPRPLDNILPVDSNNSSGPNTPDRSSTPRPAGVGIAGLEARGLTIRKNNEAVLGTAFEDLEALMASARDVVALAEKFAQDTRSTGSQSASSPSGLDPLLSESAAAVGMIATKDMLSSGTNKLYITELARNLAEYVTDERRGVLKGQGGIMSLVDLWATFNRSRNGVELVSPSDFHKAAEMWAALNLPVRLREFKSGLLVVQTRDRSDDKTVAQLKRWLQRKMTNPPAGTDSENRIADNMTGRDVSWDWESFGYGATAQDAAQEFGWSLGVATEELEMAEERGALCREEGIEGLKFWLNFLVEDE